MPVLTVRVTEELRFFLPARHRGGHVQMTYDGSSSLGHVVESLGVPLPEVGRLRVAGRDVAPSYRPQSSDVVDVSAVPRPQPVPAHRYLLDVHLGALARRLRLVGVDAGYRNDAADDALLAWASAQRRVLLTQDRGLLRRRALSLGAYVRGAGPREQLRDVIDRFAPPLAPFTRCTACNGVLEPVSKQLVLDALAPGTRRSYDQFARCPDCHRVYWRGAHAARLDAVVAAARAVAGP